MGYSGTVALIVLVAALGAGIYLLSIEISSQNLAYAEFKANVSENLPEKSHQFYPNLRFKEKRISYYIEESCDNEKKVSALNSLGFLSERSVLKFYSANEDDAMLGIYCSGKASEPEDSTHFIAGEGGPTKIVNASNFYVIKKAQVTLYRNEKCDSPHVALHEIMHALGFDHSANESSIMFPVTSCRQVFDDYLAEEINKIYLLDPKPDLFISGISANKTGKYIQFSVNIDNIGLEDSKSSYLKIYSSGKEFARFSLDMQEIGQRKIFSVRNLKVPGDSYIISFEIMGENGEDMNPGNNLAEVHLISIR